MKKLIAMALTTVLKAAGLAPKHDASKSRGETGSALLPLDTLADLPGFFAQRGSAAWQEAWGALKAEFGDVRCLSPDGAEEWQYMGTHQQPDGSWQHHFRHRALPPVGASANLVYPATAPAI
ncbi:hypothetical protein [Azospirillum sp. sgz302134]